MKILAIRGKNLASLAGEFEMDFQQEPLRSSGLFAISGPTGAGKSTLLDALCMALYEKTPRLLSAGNKLLPDVGEDVVTQQDVRNLLRRGTAEGFAEVDFVGNDGVSYRARWSVRRARNKTNGSLQNTSMTLATLADEKPIGGTKREVLAEIVKRIGLSFEQFTRAVLLAQNEFSAFLKADDNERGELLETLTGRTIYSLLSQRAYARARQEQAALQRIHDRLADQKPLSEDARSQAEQNRHAAQTLAHALDTRRALLEVQLRWYQDDLRLEEKEKSASEDLQEKQAAQHAAVVRRSALYLVESVQDARPLVAELDRVAGDLAQDNKAIADWQARLAEADLVCLNAGTTFDAAQAALLSAEQAQTGAALELDQAKDLDGRIGASLPGHQHARQAQAAAIIAVTQAQQRRQARQTELDAVRATQQVTSQWLEQHLAWKVLSENWPRWDLLFRQAGAARKEIAQQQSTWSAATQTEAQQQKLLDSAVAAASLAGEASARAAELLEQALRQQAMIDIELLQEQRPIATTRSEQLNSARQYWTTASEQQNRLHKLEQQSCDMTQVIAQAQAGLTLADNQIPGLSAALMQAERSLKSAEAACAENVETLRAALEDDVPCPVCGATSHPYITDNPPLHAMLASLQAEVENCRQQLQMTRQQQAGFDAQIVASRLQLTGLEGDRQELQLVMERQSQGWQRHPLAGELANVAATEQEAWFASESLAVQTQLEHLKQTETAWHSLVQARDAAQRQSDLTTRDWQAKKDTASKTQSALEKTRGAKQAASDQLAESRQRLSNDLVQLDAAFSTEQQTGWKDVWQTSPEEFHSLCAKNAAQWQEQRMALDHQEQRIATLASEVSGLEDMQVKTEADLQQATQAFVTSDTTLATLKSKRNLLFDGQPVQQIEVQLASAIAVAKTAVIRAQEHCTDSRQVQTRCSEALHQSRTRLIAHTGEAQLSAGKLADWLEHYNVSGGQETLTTDQLRALLAKPFDWIDNERQHLQAIDAALLQAVTVLQERTRHRTEHQTQRPQNDELIINVSDDAVPESVSAQTATAASIDPIGWLQQVLAGVNTELQQARASATQWQLQLAQDDARRAQAADMLASLAQQEATHRLWEQLNDLIGAADGKKFRNYAQQVTLDVLLGYANSHLRELSRRYRLQRINHTLGLMVLDQDMANELRSVHSLSGGESFLVSLALALGLASLSSNRVRVESLFIDEGFGSLDADTLRVAMDALDGLQSMGRKVGIISHVQEMTERIATRVLVQKTSGGRSSVTVG